MSRYEQDNEEFMHTWAVEVISSRIDYLMSQGLDYGSAYIIACEEYDKAYEEL